MKGDGLARVLGLVLLAAMLWGGWVWSKGWWSDQLAAHRLSQLPKAFAGVQETYVNAETFGLGPGGSETGVFVFAMPPTLTERVRQEGLVFLHRADAARVWQETPPKARPAGMIFRNKAPAGACRISCFNGGGTFPWTPP